MKIFEEKSIAQEVSETMQRNITVNAALDEGVTVIAKEDAIIRLKEALGCFASVGNQEKVIKIKACISKIQGLSADRSVQVVKQILSINNKLENLEKIANDPFKEIFVKSAYEQVSKLIPSEMLDKISYTSIDVDNVKKAAKIVREAQDAVKSGEEDESAGTPEDSGSEEDAGAEEDTEAEAESEPETDDDVDGEDEDSAEAKDKRRKKRKEKRKAKKEPKETKETKEAPKSKDQDGTNMWDHYGFLGLKDDESPCAEGGRVKEKPVDTASAADKPEDEDKSWED